MKKLLVLLTLLLTACAPAFGQGVKIYQLTQGSNPSSSDLFLDDQGATLGSVPGTTYVITGAQLHNFMVGPGTVTIAGSKTLTVSNTVTIAGVDTSTLNIGLGGTLGSAAFTSTSNYAVAFTVGVGLIDTSNVLSLATPTTTNIGGVEAITTASNEWIDSIDTSGVPHQSQPGFSSLSGLMAPAQIDTTNANAGDCLEYTGTGVQWAHVGWSSVTNTPTNLAGYGIVDGLTAAQIEAGPGVTTTMDGTNVEVSAAGASITVGSNLAGAGISYVSGTLDSTNGFNGANQLVKLGSGGALPALNGSALTGISASATAPLPLTTYPAVAIIDSNSATVMGVDANNNGFLQENASGNSNQWCFDASGNLQLHAWDGINSVMGFVMGNTTNTGTGPQLNLDGMLILNNSNGYGLHFNVLGLGGYESIQLDRSSVIALGDCPYSATIDCSLDGQIAAETVQMPPASGQFALMNKMTGNTTGTITFNSSKQNQTIYNTSSSTLSTATITLPNTSQPGQVLRFVTKGSVTTLTISGTVDIGTSPASLTAPASLAWECDTSGHWIRLY